MQRIFQNIVLGLSILLITGQLLVAGYVDTGMRIWKQPDGTTFTARLWGDEFFHWRETQNGYRIVQDGFNGWYYYAQLGKNGDFIPTSRKVGIDTPPAFSYKLKRSDQRIAEIHAKIDEFNRSQSLPKISQPQTSSVTTYKVGIVLVEFSDITHYTDTTYSNGYYKADFDSMLFSHNHYWEDYSGSLHPEGDSLFGSFRDYWEE